MADDIKIRVGVSNNVKAGMGDIVRDIQSEGKNLGSRFGRGFKSAMTGDIAGAMNAILGGFVAGAAVAGWNAGKAIDQAFKISDSVANWWTKGLDAAGAAWDQFYKKLRAQREALASLLTSGNKLDQSVFGIREKSKMARMSAGEKVDYLSEGLTMAGRGKASAAANLERAAAEASRPSKNSAQADARKKNLEEATAERDRIVLIYEEMNADYQDALAERSKAWAANQKSEYEATKKAEQDKADSAKRTFEIEKEWRKMGREASEKALKDELEGVKKAEAANGEKQRSIKESLTENEKAARQAADRLAIAENGGSWKSAQQDKRAKDRAADREIRILEQAMAMEGRGVKLPPRMQAMMDALGEAGKARREKANLDALDIEAKKAQIEMKNKIVLIEAELARNLQMK